MSAVWFLRRIWLRPRGRTGRCWTMGVMLAITLAASMNAHAGSDGISSVESEALSQMSLDALSQGVITPGAWKPRAALIGLGVAGLYLGGKGPSPSSRPRDTARRAAYRLALPVAGAALGSLLACRKMCDEAVAPEPLIGATAGALVAHVVDVDTNAGRAERTPAAASPEIDWTFMVALAPGSYSLGIVGRF